MSSLTPSYQTETWTQLYWDRFTVTPRAVEENKTGSAKKKCCGYYSALEIYCPCCQCCRQIMYLNGERGLMPEGNIEITTPQWWVRLFSLALCLQSTRMSQQVFTLDLTVWLNLFHKHAWCLIVDPVISRRPFWKRYFNTGESWPSCQHFQNNNA